MNPNDFQNGWTCEKCGSWVPNGTYHTCINGTGNNPVPAPYQINFLPYWPLFERIAVALEKIAEVLAKKAAP
jgi:hypothetical protein